MRKKSKALVVAMCALVLALGVNATLAWLTDKTDEVENTFTVGDINITLQEHKLQFSEVGLEDLKWITGVANSVVSYAVTARQDMNLDAVRKVSKLEDEMDTLEEEMREKHIERLSKQICNPSSGVIFLDIVSNLERISDHAYNVAGYVKDEL